MIITGSQGTRTELITSKETIISQQTITEKIPTTISQATVSPTAMPSTVSRTNIGAVIGVAVGG